MQNITAILAAELGCAEKYVENVAALLDEGNTIPFIARYRKEAHGGMDDTMLRTLETRLQYLRNLQARRAEVKELIAAQEKLTDALAQSIDAASTLAEIEDIYRRCWLLNTSTRKRAWRRRRMRLRARETFWPSASPMTRSFASVCAH